MFSDWIGFKINSVTGEMPKSPGRESQANRVLGISLPGTTCGARKFETGPFPNPRSPLWDPR